MREGETLTVQRRMDLKELYCPAVFLGHWLVCLSSWLGSERQIYAGTLCSSACLRRWQVPRCV